MVVIVAESAIPMDTVHNPASGSDRYERHLLHAIHEETPEGILVVNEMNQVVSHNRRFLEIFGIDPASIRPKSMGSVVGSSDVPILRHVVGRVKDPESFLK